MLADECRFSPRCGLVAVWIALEESLKLTWDGDGAFTIDLSGKYPQFRIYAEAETSHMDRLLPMTPDFAVSLLATPKSERTGYVFRLGGKPTKQLSGKRVCRLVSEIGRKAGIIVRRQSRRGGSGKVRERLTTDAGHVGPLFGIPRDSRGPVSNLFICSTCGFKMYQDGGRHAGSCRCGASR